MFLGEYLRQKKVFIVHACFHSFPASGGKHRYSRHQSGLGQRIQRTYWPCPTLPCPPSWSGTVSQYIPHPWGKHFRGSSKHIERRGLSSWCFIAGWKCWVWPRVYSQVLREKWPSVTQPIRHPVLRKLRLRHSLRLSPGDTGSPPRQTFRWHHGIEGFKRKTFVSWGLWHIIFTSTAYSRREDICIQLWDESESVTWKCW